MRFYFQWSTTDKLAWPLRLAQYMMTTMRFGFDGEVVGGLEHVYGNDILFRIAFGNSDLYFVRRDETITRLSYSSWFGQTNS